MVHLASATLLKFEKPPHAVLSDEFFRPLV